MIDSEEPTPGTEPHGEILLEFSTSNAGKITYDAPSVFQQVALLFKRITLDKVPLYHLCATWETERAFVNKIEMVNEMGTLKSKLTRRDLLSCIPLMTVPFTPRKATAGASIQESTTPSTGDKPLGHTGRRVGIALGAGGANGLAHIAMLEVLDELGIRPHRIAGASIGAVIGAMYAAGMPALEIRNLANGAFTTTESDDLHHLVSDQVLEWLEFIELELGNGGLLDSQKILSHFYRSIGVQAFSELEVPLDIVAGDLWKKEQVVLNSGPLLPAVQASMAIPGVFEPVVLGNRVLIDGGTVNPVPWDLLFKDCDIVVGIDVSGVRSRPESNEQSYFEILFNSIKVMQNAIIAEKARHRRPDILIAPEIKDVRALEFYAANQVFEQSSSAKERFRSELAALITTSPARR